MNENMIGFVVSMILLIFAVLGSITLANKLALRDHKRYIQDMCNKYSVSENELRRLYQKGEKRSSRSSLHQPKRK